jgi:hypothetical protein
LNIDRSRLLPTMLHVWVKPAQLSSTAEDCRITLRRTTLFAVLFQE